VKKRTREVLLFNADVPNLPHKAVVYSNKRIKICSFAERLEDYLDSENVLFHHDVLTLVGTLSRDEKAQIINLFVNGTTEPELNPNILCATSSVGNAGIDSSEVRSALRLDFPPSIKDTKKKKQGVTKLISVVFERYVFVLIYTTWIVYTCDL
jgi:superfamily II DNA helicase RecQ